MLSTEDIASWFTGAQADERIHTMCVLLDCCLPLEIRFFGTYLETIAQKDYQAFRQAESNANNPADLSYLYCVANQNTLHKLCVCLALLHSSNRQGAAMIFGILSQVKLSTILEGELYAEFSLLLNMSVNHPAFSFHQKYVLRSTLNQLKQNAPSSKDSIEVVSDLSASSSTLFYPDGESSLACPSILESQLLPAPTKDSDLVVDGEEQKCSDVKVILSTPEKSPPVFVKELKILGIKKRAENKPPKHELKKRSGHEYILEVTWGDDKTKTVHKSYEEMFDFQCKLRKMYPTKVDEHGQPWKLPFLPGRIRLFNKPEQKGEKTPIPDIADYARLFGSLPKFVRGCDHVVRFFQHPDFQSKSRDKKAKGLRKEEKAGKLQSRNETKHKQLDSPHKIAEAVRDQSLNKDSELKSTSLKSSESRAKPHDNKTNLPQIRQEEKNDATSEFMDRKALVDENSNHIVVCASTGTEDVNVQGDQLINSKENCLHGKNGIVQLSTAAQTAHSTATVLSAGNLDEIDAHNGLKLITSTENGLCGKNGLVKLNSASQSTTTATTSASFDSSFSQPLSGDSPPFHPQFSIPLQTTLQMYGQNGFHSPLPSFPESIAVSTSNTMTSSYPPSLPSPTDSLANSPVFNTGSLNCGFLAHNHPMTVRDWLKSLRLHKYSELIQEQTFDELLKLSDADLDKFGMTAGAKRRLRVNLETLRTRGCFTSNGTRLVDILHVPLTEAALSAPRNSAHSNGGLMTPSSSTSSGSCFGYSSDTDFVHGWSESDSASEGSSDLQSESCTQVTFASFVPFGKSGLLNGCRLSCYNCGSLGHVGGQCMAPNMDRAYYGYHLAYDAVQEC